MLTKNSSLKTMFSGVDFSKYSSKTSDFVNEFSSRANQPGKFLNWVNLPQDQAKKLHDIYSLASKLKSQTGVEKLSVMGIGGSKHTVEHMLGINGLNINSDKIYFYSDVDSISFARFLEKLGNDVLSSSYMIASKSGSTFETKDGFLRIQKMLEDAYIAKGQSLEEAKKSAAKHFIAVTDKNAEKAADAADSLSADLELNDALKEGIFWADAKLNGIEASVHQYMGSMFENTVYWHAQMQNESVKDTLKQIAKVPDAMHHSAEAHFNPANKLVFALTVPVDKGVCAENAEAYIGALTKSYESSGAFFKEYVETSKLGLTPEAAGAVTQLRAFATCYQEIVEAVMQNKALPEVLDSVLQPHVEFYKKNLKGGVVVPGRISG